MKYWFFNGEDIVGPLAVQEMALQPGFVSTSLICPEQASEDAESWKPAFCFSEFHFDEITGQLALVSAPEPAPVRAVRVRRRLQKPAKPVVAEIIHLSKAKEDEPVSAPIALAKGQPVDLILPSSMEETSHPTAETQKPETITEPPVKQTTPIQEEESCISSCVLPVVPEKISEGNLPLLPEGDAPYIFKPETEFSLEDEMIYNVPETSLPQDPVKYTTLSQEKSQEVVPPPSRPEEKSFQPEDALEPKVSQVKARLVSTPEIEEFLTDQRLAIAPARRASSNWAFVWFALLLLLPGVIGLLVQGGCFSTKKPVVETAPATLPVLEKDTVEELTEVPEAFSEQDPVPTDEQLQPAEEKALTAVQNYTLPAQKGTIASYFARLYKERLQQGYTASWSAEPLHNNTYIVKYRVAKTRAEPVVYVFQADVAKNQLTGALNNAALDLVGKI